MPKKEKKAPKTVEFTSNLPNMPRPNNLKVVVRPAFRKEVGGRIVTVPGKYAQFKGGMFSTDDPEIITYLTEGLWAERYYGVKVLRVDDAEKVLGKQEKQKEKTDKGAPKAVTLQDGDKKERKQPMRKVPAKKEAESPVVKKGTQVDLSSFDAGKASYKELQAAAAALNIEYIGRKKDDLKADVAAALEK